MTDQEQNILEAMEDQDGITQQTIDAKTRIIVRANGATERVAHGTGEQVNIGKNAGVVSPASDKPGTFLENQIGKP